MRRCPACSRILWLRASKCPTCGAAIEAPPFLLTADVPARAETPRPRRAWIGSRRPWVVTLVGVAAVLVVLFFGGLRPGSSGGKDRTMLMDDQAVEVREDTTQWTRFEIPEAATLGYAASAAAGRLGGICVYPLDAADQANTPQRCGDGGVASGGRVAAGLHGLGVECLPNSGPCTLRVSLWLES